MDGAEGFEPSHGRIKAYQTYRLSMPQKRLNNIIKGEIMSEQVNHPEKETLRKLTNSQKMAEVISKLLLPCPFCGHEAGIRGSDDSGIQCACMNADCGASLPSWLKFERDENVIDKIALAIEYWNIRKTKEER